MQTQLTDGVKREWRLNCWRICVMNLLVGMALYMMFPFISRILSPDGTEGSGCFLLFGLAYVAGLLLPGPFCNYWLDVFKRKGMCRRALFLLVVTQMFLFWLLPPSLMPFCGLLLGAAVGVFQISAGSTLLVDLSPADCRTLTSHIYYWFTRLALALGPVMGLLIVSQVGIFWLPVFSLVCGSVAFLLLQSVDVPFRAPLEPPVVSLDRFWMPRAFRLFAGLLPVMLAAGLMLSLYTRPEWYAMMASGFFCSLSVHRMLWAGRDVRREILFGMVLMMSAVFLCVFLLSFPLWPMSLVALLFAWGLGHVSSRYLLFFVRVSRHCERGTAQTTYLIAWESGLVLGLSAGLMVGGTGSVPVALTCLLLLLSSVVYLLFIHRWLVKACWKENVS